MKQSFIYNDREKHNELKKKLKKKSYISTIFLIVNF
jgi:hypothetical protein